jgi:hypothetical protein
MHLNPLKAENKLAAWKWRVLNTAALIDRMKIRNIPGRFFFGVEKAAVLEAMTERQAGPNQKEPGVLLFDVRRNQCRFMLAKSKPR